MPITDIWYQVDGGDLIDLEDPNEELSYRDAHSIMVVAAYAAAQAAAREQMTPQREMSWLVRFMNTLLLDRSDEDRAVMLRAVAMVLTLGDRGIRDDHSALEERGRELALSAYSEDEPHPLDASAAIAEVMATPGTAPKQPRPAPTLWQRIKKKGGPDL
jgi:hypothetical protein